MSKIKHIKEKRLYKICDRLFEIHSGMESIGFLFESQARDAFFGPHKLFRLGQLIRILARELSTQEDILRCGYDSQAGMKKKK